MASLTVKVPQGFPAGTTLSVYVDRVGDIDPSGAVPVSTAVVAADSSVTLTGLTVGIPYQAGAVIDGKWRSFLVEIPLGNPSTLDGVITELAAHEVDTTDVHGITSTPNLATHAEVAAAIAGIPSALATLSGTAPDKLIWQFAGGTIVELYGLGTAAGMGLVNQDLFNSDTAAAYARLEGGAMGTLIAFDSGNTRMAVNNADSTQHRFFRSDWTAPDTGDLEYTIKGSADMNAFASTNKLGIGFFNASNEYVEFFAQSDMWGQGQLYVNGVLRGTAGSGVSSGGGPNNVNGFPYLTPAWIKLKRTGNVIAAEIWRTDPALGGSPTSSVSYTLTAPEQVKFGSGVGQRPLWTEQRNGTGNPMWVDDFTEVAALAEQHDLFVAVTAQGGARTVKRLFGSLGGIFRSEFVQPADLAPYAPVASPAFSGSVGLPTYTTATRPTPAAVGNGKLIYVSDGAAGSNVQVTVAGAWVGIG